MSARSGGHAREVARLVARAGWPVIPMLTNTDEKKPCVSWKSDPSSVCRSEADVVEKWPPRWPRWAAVCGVPRALDGRTLVNLDADSEAAVAVARKRLPDHTRVKTGRPEGGEHTWMTLPADHDLGMPVGWRLPLLRRFYLAGDLDWRGGDCIALLPGSLWAPRSAPGVTYDHISGPALPEVLDVPQVFAEVVRKMAPADLSGSPSSTPSGLVDLSMEGAFEKFLAAVTRSGRIVKRRGQGEAYVQCPGSGHPDQNRNRPALHVTARGGGIGLFCFARGCTAEEITAALGLEMSDLYDDLRGLEIEIVDDQDNEGTDE
jgi:hypothetical protein